MYVKKYSADTVDEALKLVKKELGPDAIILKTTTNKGVKGKFKRGKIEITAAVTEKDYQDKAQVDHVLNSEQKEKFYQEHAEDISKSIKQYARPGQKEQREIKDGSTHYGKLALNKTVREEFPRQQSFELDNFLNESASSTSSILTEGKRGQNSELASSYNDSFDVPVNKGQTNLRRDEKKVATATDVQWDQWDFDVDQQNRRIEDLELQLKEITRVLDLVPWIDHSENFLLLRNKLKACGVTEAYIQKIIKRATREFTQEECKDFDKLFDFALKEMNEDIMTDTPLLIKGKDSLEASITILMSEVSTGQTHLLYKLGQVNKQTVYLSYGNHQDRINLSSLNKILNKDIIYCETLPVLILELRKYNEKGFPVVVDLKIDTKTSGMMPKICEDLRKSFPVLEILLCMSAIHSELYNKQQLNKYKNLCDGVALGHLDLCLNYGPIFNNHIATTELPLKIFGTGPMLPEDFEVATSERLLAGMFQL